MFTGLIQDVGKLVSFSPNADGAQIHIRTKLANQVQVDDSVATNGVCLTATKVLPESGDIWVQAVRETLKKTTLQGLRPGNELNLELALRPMDRLGGHFVQGHVNGIGTICSLKAYEKSYELWLRFAPELRKYMVSEGSICLHGISLTIADLHPSELKVAVIPHTWTSTNLRNLRVGDQINIEVDILAKYIENFSRVSSAKGQSVAIDALFQ